MIPQGIDFVADTNGVEISRLSKLHDFPDFVKSASVASTLNPGELPVTSYADQSSRQFPCHTPAATWLSNLFFQEKKASFNRSDSLRIQGRINSFSDYWRIRKSVDSTRTAGGGNSFGPINEKQATDQLSDDDFAYVWESEGGLKQRHLRIINQQEVKAASDWLLKNRDEIPFSDRNVIAKRILSKASEFSCSDVPNQEFLSKQAGDGFGSPEKIADMIYDRSRLATSQSERDILENLAHTTRANPDSLRTKESRVKIASVIDLFDRDYNLTHKYTEMVPRPDDVIFEVTEKVAKETVGKVFAMTTGKIYNIPDLKMVKKSDLENLFGPDFAKQASSGLKVNPSSLAEIASTLPLGDAEMFDAILKESGVKPFTIKRSSGLSEPQKQELKGMAELY